MYQFGFLWSFHQVHHLDEMIEEKGNVSFLFDEACPMNSSFALSELAGI
jgi:hypothetical protein